MTVGGISSITSGEAALSSAKFSSEKGKFSELLSQINEEKARSQGIGKNVSSDEVSYDGRLNGDYTSGFSGTFISEADRHSAPRGAAANQANPNIQPKTVDRTSKLYEKSLELESYFVKNMLSAMRKTVVKSNGDNYAQKMYEDMLYDEYAAMMTKNAGFGLADMMYLQLSGN